MVVRALRTRRSPAVEDRGFRLLEIWQPEDGTRGERVTPVTLRHPGILVESEREKPGSTLRRFWEVIFQIGAKASQGQWFPDD